MNESKKVESLHLFIKSKLYKINIFTIQYAVLINLICLKTT